MAIEASGNPSEPLDLILETSEGAVWFSPGSGHFLIRFGNIRWEMNQECLAPYRNYLRGILGTRIAMDPDSPPLYLKTKDPAVTLAFTRTEMTGLAFLLDAAESIHTIENTKD